MIRRRDIDYREPLLRPLLTASSSFYVFCAVLLIVIGWAGYAWGIQLTQGLGVTDMRTPVGAPWGIYIVNFVFFACMAHGGMAVSAVVHLFKAKSYKPIARMGEVLTIVTLMMAGMSIVIDMGRPDRLFNMIRYWPERIGSSPLSWDITVIILYFILSLAYLWLTMRRDLARYADRFTRRGLVYRILLVGYRPEENEKVDRLAWWLSIAIVLLIVMLSGGVIPWIFGLLPAQSGWFSALAGPYFLTAALASSIAAVILVASLLRKTFGWEEQIKPDIFRGLGVALGILLAFYVYLTFTEQITMSYAAPHPELAISEMVVKEELSPLFWGTMIFGFIIPGLLLLVQALQPRWFSPGRTVLAAVIIVIAFWAKRFLIIVPSLLRPLLPFATGTYHPSWVEWSIVAGIFALAILLYALFIKVFPIVEVPEE